MKRVLIIAYFFPPISNMGSHRMLRFVKSLPSHGWEPIVLTGNLAGWSRIDEDLLSQLPSNLEISRIGSIDLTSAWNKIFKNGSTNVKEKSAPRQNGLRQKLTTFLNRWVMIPDKYFPWISSASKEGMRIIREHGVDAIYSTSDPVSNHLVGLHIAKKTGLPWIAEFRDLWLGSPYFARAHPTALHRRIHGHLERKVVKRVNKIITLSKGIGSYFSREYTNSDPTVIYNCFESKDYAGLPSKLGKFRILYAGALYSSRSPAPFFDGFHRFIEQNSLLPSDIEFVLVGGSPDFDLPLMVQKYKLTDFVKLIGTVSHKQALEHMEASTILLAIQSPDDDIHVPGKLFEYIGAGRPILAISQPCEVSHIVMNEKLGWVAEPNPTSVSSVLSQIYKKYKEDGDCLKSQAESIQKFEIQDRTRQLAKVLNDLLT